MKKKTKIILNSLLIGTLLGSSVAFSAVLSSCSNSKEQELNNQIVNNISISSLKLKKQTKTQFYNLYHSNINLLNKLIIDNLSLLVKGQTKQIENNFSTKLITKNKDIYINLTINPGFWYKNNVLVKDSPLSQEILLNGFEKELTPTESGTYNNLNVDTHLKLVDILMAKLNINPLFNISTLNNEKLNKVYKDSVLYNQLNCEITNGTNTKDGILILNINGTYNGENYKDVKIKITGFKTSSNLSKAFISNIKLDLNEWFKNLQPTQTINKNDIMNISSKDFVEKYISFANVSYLDSTIEFMSLKDALLNNYLIEFEKPKIQRDGKTFTLITKTIKQQTKKYENNQWIDDELIDITTNSQPNQALVDIPTNNDSINFLLNSTTINESVLQTQYATYFKAQAKNAKHWNYIFPKIPNLIQNDYIERIKDTYFKDKKNLILNLSNDPSTILANDTERKLEFTIHVFIDDEQPKGNKTFSFKDKTKNLNEFINQNISQIQNQFILKPDFGEKSSWAYKTAKYIKKQYNSEIDKIFSEAPNQTKEISVNLSLPFLSTIMNRFHYSNEGNWNIDDNIKKIISNSIQDALFVFNKPIIFEKNSTPLINLTQNGQLDEISGLYRYDNDNEFMINAINYEVEEIFKKLFVTRHDNNALTFKLPFITSITLNDRNIEQKSWISFIILKSQWESIN